MLWCIAYASLLALTFLGISFANPTLEDNSQSKSSRRRSRLEAHLFGRQYCTYYSCTQNSCPSGYYCGFGCCFPDKLVCSPACSYSEMCESGICVDQGGSMTSSYKAHKGNGKAIGGIAGGGWGGVVGIAIVILLWWRKRKTSSATTNSDTPAYTAGQGESYELKKEPEVHVSSVSIPGPHSPLDEITSNTIRPLAYSLEPQQHFLPSSLQADPNPGFPFNPQPYPSAQDSRLSQQPPLIGQEQSSHHHTSQHDFQPAEVPRATPGSGLRYVPIETAKVPRATPGSDLHYVPIERIESKLPGANQSPPP